MERLTPVISKKSLTPIMNIELENTGLPADAALRLPREKIGKSCLTVQTRKLAVDCSARVDKLCRPAGIRSIPLAGISDG